MKWRNRGRGSRDLVTLVVAWITLTTTRTATTTCCCDAFVVNFQTTRRSSALYQQQPQEQQHLNEQGQPADHQPVPRKKNTRRGNRPPRFSQIVHKPTTSSSLSSSLSTRRGGRSGESTAKRTPSSTFGKTSSSSNSNSPAMNADRVWQSRKKSVEELEDILAQRWGTNLSTFTAQDWEDDDDDDNDNGTSNGTPAPVFRAKPVQDPWSPPPSKTKQVSHDYYDEDDEGYDNNGKRRNKEQEGGGGMSFDYMMAPKPAGGSGHTTRSTSSVSSSSSTSEQSYFFRPPPVDAETQTSESSHQNQNNKKQSKKSLSLSEEASSSQLAAPAAESNKPKKTERIIPIPLLDEEGDPICLTTSQAERIFAQVSGRSDLIRQTTTTSNVLEDEYAEEDEEEYDDDYEYVDELDEQQDEEAEYAESFPLVTVAAEAEKSWQDLGIDQGILLKNLYAMSCMTPLPVQQKACPDVLQGRDVVIGTYTGSGKTHAFLVPALQRLLASNAPADELRILIVAPGRELASQIVSVAREVCQGTPYTPQLAIGGTTFSRNLQTIRQRRPSILVGTPGRLAELIVGKPGEKSGRLKTPHLQTLVLDEFDALLEYKPHREPTSALVERLQRRRPDLQSILCSATATDVLQTPKFQRFVRPDHTLALTDQDDVFVTGDNQPTRVSRTVMHGVVHVPHRRFALNTIRRILHTDPLPQQILMFVDSSRKVDLMVEKLETMDILAAPLHGGSRNDKMDRAEVSKALREGYVGIVVATELAARGLDAPLLTHVINVDLATDASHYAHRAGRCGRGGRPGVVLNLTTDPKERKVPQKFADQLGIDLYTVDVRNGKLNVVDPDSVDFEAL